MNTQSIYEGALNGAMVAPIEVTATGQVLTYTKNWLVRNPGLTTGQAIKAFPKDPRVWYTGYSAHASFISAATAVQYAAFEYFQYRSENPWASSVLAGGVTALFASPMEMFMVTKDNTKGSVMDTMRTIGLRYLYKGYVHAATRDAIFVAGYKSLSPMVGDYLRRTWNVEDSQAAFAGGMAAGVAAGFFSQFSDTISTVVKGSVTDAKAPATMREYVSRFGVAATFNGGTLRWLVRMPIAVVIYTLWDQSRAQPKS